MATIPTIIMVKDDEEIIVNAPDRDKFVGLGYANKPAEKAKQAELPKPDKTQTAAPNKTGAPVDDKNKPGAPADGKGK
jgi:hypothetical protein